MGCVRKRVEEVVKLEKPILEEDQQRLQEEQHDSVAKLHAEIYFLMLMVNVERLKSEEFRSSFLGCQRTNLIH